MSNDILGGPLGVSNVAQSCLPCVLGVKCGGDLPLFKGVCGEMIKLPFVRRELGEKRGVERPGCGPGLHTQRCQSNGKRTSATGREGAGNKPVMLKLKESDNYVTATYTMLFSGIGAHLLLASVTQ